MIRDINKFTQGQYDMLVIGGGINGAAIAHMAALNGLKTALLEKGDFASGTSSKSTKLIHGGLRYLENLQFGFIREALRERSIQLKSAPHLVRPLKFVIPVYKSDRRPLWMMAVGVWLYDLLSCGHVIARHETLGAEETRRLMPGIYREGLVGAVVYWDAQMNDARLCLENVLSADENGTDVANYAKVRSLIRENGKAVGVQAYDSLGRTAFTVRARKIVCAVGPWTNMFMQNENSGAGAPVRTTKGVHIVCKGPAVPHALLVPGRNDRRVFFVIPWMGHNLIGTTDTDYDGNPDDAAANPQDIDYLIEEASRVLPGAGIVKENIIATFTGLRPLARQGGAPARVSRRHVIKESHSGLVYVFGGKYTTYRKIAEDVLRRVTCRTPRNAQKRFLVYGSGLIGEDPAAVGQKYDMAPGAVKYLMDFYGSRFGDVLKLTTEDPGLKKPLCVCSPVIRAQVLYAIRTEMACTQEDILMRRLTMGYQSCPKGRCRREVQKFVVQYLKKEPKGESCL